MAPPSIYSLRLPPLLTQALVYDHFSLSEAICWILSNSYAIPYLIHLLDGFLIMSIANSIPAVHLSIVFMIVFMKLSVPPAQDKNVWAKHTHRVLRYLDSLNFQASLPKERLMCAQVTILIASSLKANPRCFKLLSVFGHLNFAMHIIQ